MKLLLAANSKEISLQLLALVCFPVNTPNQCSTQNTWPLLNALSNGNVIQHWNYFDCRQYPSIQPKKQLNVRLATQYKMGFILGFQISLTCVCVFATKFQVRFATGNFSRFLFASNENSMRFSSEINKIWFVFVSDGQTLRIILNLLYTAYVLLLNVNLQTFGLYQMAEADYLIGPSQKFAIILYKSSHIANPCTSDQCRLSIRQNVN